MHGAHVEFCDKNGARIDKKYFSAQPSDNDGHTVQAKPCLAQATALTLGRSSEACAPLPTVIR